MKAFLLFCLLGFSSSLLAQQVCHNDIQPSTPRNRFLISGNNVTDTKTGLIWMRCSLGQSGVNCKEGIAKTFTWEGALMFVAKNHQGWRVPNIKELASIVEVSCYEPAINLQVFLNTMHQDVAYLSSSPDETFGNGVLAIDFYDGADAPQARKHSPRYVRLVKTK